MTHARWERGEGRGRVHPSTRMDKKVCQVAEQTFHIKKKQKTPVSLQERKGTLKLAND